jgi:23S rRNA (guanine745-N1)-methyltransferase
MIGGRRAFFAAGHYRQLADSIADLILRYLDQTQGQTVLDAGCGEGYYLRRLRNRLTAQRRETEPNLAGLDISKHGIRAAAKADLAGLYAVASTHRMPVRPQKVAVLLTHFSPVSADDFRRVVGPGGVVLVGSPGPEHLFGLKELLYDVPARHEPDRALIREPGFELLMTHRIRYAIDLQGPGQVSNLLLMTPYFWSASREDQTRLAEVPELRTEVDVMVRAFRRVP